MKQEQLNLPQADDGAKNNERVIITEMNDLSEQTLSVKKTH